VHVPKVDSSPLRSLPQLLGNHINVRIPIQREIGQGEVAFIGHGVNLPLGEAALVEAGSEYELHAVRLRRRPIHSRYVSALGSP